MAENKILEELRAKLTDSLDENNDFLRREAERSQKRRQCGAASEQVHAFPPVVTT